MNYDHAVKYIDEIPKFTTKNDLSHTRDCLTRLGNPQKRFRVLHIAGTNGKGSTSAFLDSMIRSGGYSCGLFTSPHLVRMNERFQIGRKSIDDETFLKAFERVYALSTTLLKEGRPHPTYFEFLFLMGMLIFAEAGVEYVVLETGLGGRLDATTSIEDPLICIITSISLDHMQYLGSTVEEIAGEKAGILVPGVPLIFDGNDERAAGVIRERAEKEGCPWICVKKEDTRILRSTEEGIEFVLATAGDRPYKIPFIAEYQVMNAALALTAMHALKDVIPVPEDRLREGLYETSWAGRMETILPGVVIDGAHNEDGVEKFLETVERFREKYPMRLLFSAVDDKDYRSMIRKIVERISWVKVYTTVVGGYRSVPAEKLAGIFREYGCGNVCACPDPEEAFRTAVSEKKKEEFLFCVGSLYLAGIVESTAEQIRKLRLQAEP